MTEFVLMGVGSLASGYLVAHGIGAVMSASAAPDTPKEPPPSVHRDLVYCERCESKTAERCVTEAHSCVCCIAPSCGFRRVTRDDLRPGDVGVTYDPGPTHPKEEEPWNHQH